MIVKHYSEQKLKRGKLFTHWEALFKEKTFKKTSQNVLLNYEMVEIEFNSNDFNQVLLFLENNRKYIVRRKIAVITTKPLLSCFLYLIGEKINGNVSCCFKLFLNERDALDWLNA